MLSERYGSEQGDLTKLTGPLEENLPEKCLTMPWVAAHCRSAWTTVSVTRFHVVSGRVEAPFKGSRDYAILPVSSGPLLRNNSRHSHLLGLNNEVIYIIIK